MNSTHRENPSFWDRRAESYAKKPVPDENAYRKTLERVASYLTPEDRVLEIGCGTGTTALTLAPHAKSIVATDLSSNMVSIARRKALEQQVENVDFLTTTLENTDLDGQKFDVVMAFNLLHLLPDVPKTLARVDQLLAPGGLFISKTPCIGEDGRAVRTVVSFMRMVGLAPYVNYFKKADLLADVKGADFDVKETGLYPEKSHSYFVVAQKRED